MNDRKLPPVEAQFADLIWAKAPLTTTELIKLCSDQFKWNRSTTYTVLRRLCSKGLFDTQDGTIHVLITKAEYEARQSNQFVEETFHGSLPAFLAAFGSQKKLSDSEIQELHRIIDKMRK